MIKQIQFIRQLTTTLRTCSCSAQLRPTPATFPRSTSIRTFSSSNHDSTHYRQPTSRVMGLDYYALLEVHRHQLRDGELKQAYYRLAKQYHPDWLTKLSESDRLKAEKKFAQITLAYSVLSDPLKRQHYDCFLDLSSIGDQDRLLHWVKINRPPEQLTFECSSTNSGIADSADSNNSTLPTNQSQSTSTVAATTSTASSTTPSKPKLPVGMPVFRSS